MTTESERLKHFWQRWNHKPDDRQEFERLRARVAEIGREFWDRYALPYPSLQKEFAFQSGTSFDPITARQITYNQSALAKMVAMAGTPYQLIFAIRCLLEAFSSSAYSRVVPSIAEALQRVFDITPNILLNIVVVDNRATIYPGGVPLLDEAVVEANLAWLQTHPKVLRPFETALKIYFSKDVSQQRNMLDNLRVAMEEMAKEVLNNDAALEKNTPELGRWLKEKDAHVYVRNMFPTLISYFTNYQNDAVKHNEDKYTPAEIEFILYLVGTFLRFIQRVADSTLK